MYANSEYMLYFYTFEEREEAVRERVFDLVPRRYSGPSRFWMDMRHISRERLNKGVDIPIAYITSTPGDCLAFGTPAQIVRAAILSVYNHNKKNIHDFNNICDVFELTQLLNQPLRSLSGGEAVKLALAKAYVKSQYSNNLIVSSPFSWLAAENFGLLKCVIDKYVKKNKKVEILALEGEDSLGDKNYGPVDGLVSLSFTVCFKDVKTELQSPIDIESSDKRIAVFSDCEYDLASPCLIEGGNGSGKTLSAYILSRAIPYDGTSTIACGGRIGFARLLMQDVLGQTLLRSFKRIVLSSRSNSGINVVEIYKYIIKEFQNYFTTVGKKVPLIGYDERLGPKTLLEMKIVLVATRLCTKPSCLILDEPDWGLSKEAAIGFVVSSIKVSHSLGIPIIIISHKPWWDNVIKSKILTQKDYISDFEFQIKLSKNEGW